MLGVMAPSNYLAVISIAVLGAGCSAAAGENKDDAQPPGPLALGGSGAGGSGSAGGLTLAGSPGISLGGAVEGSGGESSGAAETCDGKLTGYVRDFSAKTHADFEPADFTFPNRVPGKYISGAVEPDIVAAALGDDKKPVYAKGDGSASGTTTGEANFASWFRDTPGMNQGRELTLTFTQDPADPTGKKWIYDSALTGGFFPIDGELLGATSVPVNDGLLHNYSFTFELHTIFKYLPGQTFRFKGDDDVWVFVNGQRVVDLGGIHSAEDRTVDLDELGLEPGGEYPLDFFFAERHFSESNFLAETSLEFTDCSIVVK
jgi:fibro-slime domain-containing protein